MNLRENLLSAVEQLPKFEDGLLNNSLTDVEMTELCVRVNNLQYVVDYLAGGINQSGVMLIDTHKKKFGTHL